MSEMRDLGDGIFSIESHVYSGMGLHLPHRAVGFTVGEGLFVYGPGPWTDDLEAALKAKGPVVGLIAPNAFHISYLDQWKRAFPNAKLYASTLAQKQIAKRHPGLEVDDMLVDDERPLEDVGTLFRLGRRGRLDEVVLYHRAAQTLIVCDLFFNVRETSSFTSKLILQMSGAFGRPASSRLMRFMMSDRAHIADVLPRVLELPVERVIPSHGEVITEDAKRQFAGVMRWALPAAAEAAQQSTTSSAGA